MRQGEIKLNLGCGEDIREGYINCDLYNPKADKKTPVEKLDFPDGYADEIFASHILEHFDRHQANELVKEWKRVLKPTGKLIVETPDFLESCKKFVLLQEDKQYTMYGHFFAKAWVPGEIHKFLYTKRELYLLMTQAGFKVAFEPATMHTHSPNLRAICTI